MNVANVQGPCGITGLRRPLHTCCGVGDRCLYAQQPAEDGKL